MVAQAFIPNPKNKSEVNHIDGNKQNNDVSNLEWVTRSENNWHKWKVLYADIIKKRREAREAIQKEKRDAKKVYCIETGEVFANQAEAARHFGVTKMAISKAIRHGSVLQKKYTLFKK